MAELLDIIVPDSEEDGAEAVLERWLHKVGDDIELNEPVAEIATDKVTMEVPAPVCGVLREILVQTGAKVTAGMLLGRMEHRPVGHEHHHHPHFGTHEPASEPTDKRDAPPAAVATPEREEMRLSPAVRRLLREHGLDPVKIPSSGRSGRLTAADVEAYLQRTADETEGAHPRGPALAADRIPHTQMRLQIADHMIASALETTPHATAVFDCDLSRVVAHRERHKADFEARGARLTYTAYFVYACVEACRVTPVVNGRWHDDAIELFDHCNVGVATALEDTGLIVPVIKNAQDLDLFGIAQKLGDLAERARTRRLSLGDVREGTITITNHGVTGSLFGTPIINQPQNAIVGIGKLEKRPKVVTVNGRDELQIKPMAYVSLTFDHRAIDGSTCNLWLQTFVGVLQEW